MARVHFTRHLVRYFPDLVDGIEVQAATVAEAVGSLDARYPGLAGYLVDDAGALRTHVNVFVDGEMVHDRSQLSDAIGPGAELHVIQALSGG